MNPVTKPVRLGKCFKLFSNVRSIVLFISIIFISFLVEQIDGELHFENDHTRYAIKVINSTAAQLGVKAYSTE